MSGELLHIGAEAEIRAIAWRGRKAVSKRRIAKGYRHPDLDRELRTSRTRSEARLLAAARAAGVVTPVVFDIDISAFELVMERIEGRTLKSVLENGGDIDTVCSMLGKAVATMHGGRVVHGDLTAANMLLDCDGRLVFIDFGLGERTEELEPRGMDLHVLMEAFKAIGLEGEFPKVTDAYVDAFGVGGNEVVARMHDIAKRGRYS